MNATAPSIPDSSEILFAEGIIGVPRARRFQLLERPGAALRILRCLDIEGFALPVVDPYVVDPAYRPGLGRRIHEALGLRENDAVLLLAIATLQSDGSALANLRAPLVINATRRRGTQVILDDQSLSLRAQVRAM